MTRAILCTLALVVGVLASGAAFAKTDKGNGPQQCGTVRWYSNEKGFGFINRVNGPHLFFHHTEIITRDPRNDKWPYIFNYDGGELVTYELTETPQGQMARGIQLVNMKSKKAVKACLELEEQ